ncbi:Calx-beta domain-containing protein [Thiotrichales bacterium HSG1]|nr:Calx-beta domain-containing protein [Thiotrichales bacterium HSG1]
MFKLIYYIPIILLLSMSSFAEEQSSFGFCELSDSTCPYFSDEEKNSPYFADIFDKIMGQTMTAALFEEPTVITAIPFKLYPGSTTDVQIISLNTNLNTSSSVSIDGVDTNVKEVLSDTELVVNVNIPEEAETDIFSNVEIDTTLLDGQSEIANGDAFLVIENTGEPEIIGITPTTVSKGSNNVELSIYGINTNFTDTSTFEFYDAEVTVINTKIHTPNFMTAFINISKNASHGPHDITITTETEIAHNSAAGLFRITDNPPILPGIIQLTKTNHEISEGIGTYSFIAERINGNDGEVSVSYIIDSTEGDIYETGILTWLDGESSTKEFDIEIADNSEYESDKTLSVKLDKITNGATLGVDTAIATIINDDPQIQTTPPTQKIVNTNNTKVPTIDDVTEIGTIQFSVKNQNSIEENKEQIVLIVERLDGSDGQVIVKYNLIEDSAEFEKDFIAVGGTLTWEDGDDKDKEITISILDDETVEENETFTIKLTNVAGNASLGLSETKIAILNDDVDDIVVEPPVDISKPTAPIEGDAVNPPATEKTPPIEEEKSPTNDDGLSSKDVIPKITEENAEISAKSIPIISYAPACPDDSSEINITCIFNRNKMISDILITENASVSSGILTGTMENHGWVSNLTIQKDGILIGGFVTGYIENEGIMANFDFRGASIIGGTLGGIITNNSLIIGVFEDVYLEANTHITGGKLTGYIIGDPNQKALLEHLVITGNGILKNVIIGEEVDIADTIMIDESVEFIQR